VNFGRTSLWWKDLVEVWGSEGWGRNFEDAFKWKIGNGDSVLFSEDSWAGNGALKRVYSWLFSLSSCKDAKVDELEKWINGSWEWQLTWRRSLFEWEKPLVCIFFQGLQGLSFDMEEKDSWVWKDGEFPIYTVKSSYNCLRRAREGENVFVYKMFWRSKVVPSALVSAFVSTWRVLENKIATRANLERRGIAVESL